MTYPNADTTTLKSVVIPDAFKQPDWVEEAFKKFQDEVKKNFDTTKSINTSLVRKLFKEIILDNKISPPYPLNKKNIGTVLDKMYKIQYHYSKYNLSIKGLAHYIKEICIS